MTTMATATHTPGPWRVDEGPGMYLHSIVGPKGEDIGYANPSDGADEPTLYPVEANARLMAAAPDMLTLLHSASHALRSYQYGNASPELAASVATAIDDAIAKAEGAQ